MQADELAVVDEWMDRNYVTLPGGELLGSCAKCGAALIFHTAGVEPSEQPLATHIKWHHSAALPFGFGFGLAE